MKLVCQAVRPGGRKSTAKAADQPSTQDPMVSNRVAVQARAAGDRNAYKLWDDEARARLDRLVRAGVQLRDLTEAMGRSRGGVLAQVERQGLSEFLVDG